MNTQNKLIPVILPFRDNPKHKAYLDYQLNSYTFYLNLRKLILEFAKEVEPVALAKICGQLEVELIRLNVSDLT